MQEGRKDPIMSEVRKLEELLNMGFIGEEEFNERKNALLGGKDLSVQNSEYPFYDITL